MCQPMFQDERFHPAEQLSVDKYHSPVILIIVIISCDVLVVAALGSRSVSANKVGVR